MAPNEAYLAGDYPYPAAMTFPRITSSMWEGSKLIDLRAPSVAKEESSVALNLESLPKKEPIGVLLPATT